MRRYLWLCPVYLLAALLPLVTNAGRNFEYEYVLLASCLILILLTLAGAIVPRRHIPIVEQQYAPYARFDALWMVIVGPAIFIIPAAVSFLTGLCQCGANGYIFWLFVQLAPAWVLAHASYHHILYQRVRGTPARKVWLFYVLCVCLMLSYAAARFWFSPQVHVYDLMIGFIHGPIYDAWIPVDSGIALVRLAHLFFALALLFGVWTLCEKRRKHLVVMCFLLGLITSVSSSFYPSVDRGTGVLNELMPTQKEHRLFTLHYLEDKSRPGKTAYADELYLEAAFHAEDLATLFGDNLPHVQIYLYPDHTKKKLWFGGGATDVADVFTPSIHITQASVPHPTLRHELVHALASGFGFHGVGFHPNMVFTEGLAVALAPEDDEVSLHEGVAMLYATKRMPSIKKLFSPMFWQVAGARAYTVAGSIILYLIDTHGFDKVKQLYAGSSWRDAFGQSKHDVLLTWRNYVLKTYPVKSKSLIADALFRYPGVLNDECPHTKADYLQPRQESVYTRLRQPLGWNPDSDYGPWHMALDPTDKSYKVKLLRDRARAIFENGTPATDALNTLLKDVGATLVWPPKTLEDIDLAILSSDMAAATGNKPDDTAWQERLAPFAKPGATDEGTSRSIQARALVTKMPSTESGPWRKFLAGWRKEFPVRKSTEPWIASYLRVRNRDKSIENGAYLQNLLPMPVEPNLHPSFYSEWYKIIAYRLSEAGDHAIAQQAMIKAINQRPASLKTYLELELRRLRFLDLNPRSR